MEDGFVPEVSGDSIKSLIARVSDRILDNEFPTVSLFNSPAQILGAMTTPASDTEDQAHANELPAMSEKAAGLINLPPEIVSEIYTKLPIPGRISLALCSKFLARVAVKFSVLVAGASESPILPSLASLQIQYQTNLEYKFLYSSPGGIAGFWRDASKRWHGDALKSSIGTLGWFRHLAGELKRLNIWCSKGIMREITYEKVKMLLETRHLRSGLFNEAASVRAAKVWFDDTMRRIEDY